VIGTRVARAHVAAADHQDTQGIGHPFTLLAWAAFLQHRSGETAVRIEL
jgi:hypothetical protein